MNGVGPRLSTTRITIAALALAPLLELAEGVLSPLVGTSTHADLSAIHAHQTRFIASVLCGTAAEVLYIVGFLCLASYTVQHSRRASRVGALMVTVGMLGFAGTRVVQAAQLQLVTGGPHRVAASFMDGAASNPVEIALLVLFLLGLLVGYGCLAFAAWRAGLSRAASLWLGVFPIVGTLVDDGHWANVVTHTLLAAALITLAIGIARRPAVDAPALLGVPLLRVLLVAAPSLGVAELVLSPLAGTTTRADLARVAEHQGLFVVSVLVGALASVLYVPAFVGLAAQVAPTAQKTARTAAVLVIVTFAGFMGVRAGQGLELQTVRTHGLSIAGGAHLVDQTFAGPIGAPILVMFLGGSILALAFLAVAAWRAGLPRVAAVALGVFPVLDLLLPGRIGSIVAHLVLLAATTTFAVALGRPATRTAVQPVPSAA